MKISQGPHYSRLSQHLESNVQYKNINLSDLQLSEFHNLVLPDRSKGTTIEDALNNFNRHFPKHSYEERDLVFQKYLDHLLANKKYVIDYKFTLRGNERGLTKEK